MAILSILNQTEGEIRFQVDDVQLCDNSLPVQHAKVQLEERIYTPLLAFSHSDDFEVVQPSGYAGLIDAVYLHPLVSAIHMAFSEHRPLLLTPDAIWMTIAQGFAQHVNNNSEELRQSLVVHSGKLTLTARSEELSQSLHWSQLIEQWAYLIGEYVNPDIYSAMQCDFSTTTPTIRTASQVVMMDAFKQYFDYRAVCICGIPWISLQGTEADWRKIRERVAMIGEYNLSWWTKRLLTICDGFIRTIQGKPDIDFWQSIYKPQSAYGTEVITGWLGYLFPYIKDNLTEAYTVKNPMFTNTPITSFFGDIEHGVRPESLPGGLSQVCFTLKLQNDIEQQTELELVAGFVGVCQNQENNCLYPEIGWVVRENKFSEILNTLKESPQHYLQPAIDWSQTIIPEELPKELFQILEQFDGAMLFGDSTHPWEILSLKDYVYIDEIVNTDNISFYQFINIKNGRCIAYKYHRYFTGSDEDGTRKRCQQWWVIVGKPIVQSHGSTVLLLEDVKVIATSISHFFERLIQAGGEYYFDSPDFVPDGIFEK